MSFYKVFAVISLAMLLFCGCKQELESFPKHERVEPSQHVHLPEHPDFQAFREIPIQFDDGSYTTWGVILNQKKLIAREIRVRGEITEVSDDCPAMTKPPKSTKKKKGKKQEGYKCTYSLPASYPFSSSCSWVVSSWQDNHPKLP